MPEELVMNTSKEKLKNYLKSKGKVIGRSGSIIIR
jgi:hypothetical protein